MKKNIGIITSSFPLSENDTRDASVFIKDFAYSLAENFQVCILTPKRRGSKNDYKKLKISFFPGLNTETAIGLSSINPKKFMGKLKLFSFIIFGIFSTLKFVKENKIDHCLSMWAIPSGIFALISNKIFGIPYSVYALGSDIKNINDYPFGNSILQTILKNAKNLYADGKELTEKVELISGKSCTFIASGRILNKKYEKISYQKFDTTKLNFMFLGRYHVSKGVLLLLEAIMKLSNEQKTKCLFHFFGGGILEEQMKKIIHEKSLESNVYINGFLNGNEIFSYMTNADYVIIPSKSGTLSMVFFEAMQSNKPVIITNVGDTNLVKKYNVGIIVEPDSTSIYEGILEAIRGGKSQLVNYSKGLSTVNNTMTSQRNESVKKFILNENF